VNAVLDGRSVGYRIIDLYGDNFDPAMPTEEWADHTKIDGKVAGYQRAIREADRLIFIYPVWWYTYPAILKGFFDRVFTQDFAFNFMKEPLWMRISKALFGRLLSVRFLYPLYSLFLPVKQRLKGKKALIINTYGGDAAGFRLYGHAPEYATDKAVLDFCGVKPVYRVNWYNTRHHKASMPESVRNDMRNKLEMLLR
jgi:putative NADPH-quinone reductase